MTTHQHRRPPDRYSAIQRQPDGTLVLPLSTSTASPERIEVNPHTGIITYHGADEGATPTRIDPRNLTVLVTRSERVGGPGRGHRNLPHGIAGEPTAGPRSAATSTGKSTGKESS